MGMQDLRQAADLEAQILSNQITLSDSLFYFGTMVYCLTFTGEVRSLATASQIKQLLRDMRIKNSQMIEFPEPSRCEFCGKNLEYLACISKTRDNDDWTFVAWSEVPQKCDCEKAIEKREIEITGRNKQKKLDEELAECKKREILIHQRFEKSGIKKRFQASRFDNFIVDTPSRKRAFQVARKYANNFESHKETGTGLYIEGTLGTGKTHLASAIAIQLMEQQRDVIFRTSEDLFLDVRKTFDNPCVTQEKVISRFRNCELLIIDDLGKEQVTEWSTALLYGIINSRYERMKPLIITTNFNEDDLIEIESTRETGSNRIAAVLSRLHETCILLTMNWDDWRGKKNA